MFVNPSAMGFLATQNGAECRDFPQSPDDYPQSPDRASSKAMERVLLRHWRTGPSGSGEKLLCAPVPAIRKISRCTYGIVIPGIQVSYRKRPRRDLFDRCGRRNTLRECVKQKLSFQVQNLHSRPPAPCGPPPAPPANT